MSWQKWAACASVDDPDALFFSEAMGLRARRATQKAKEICSQCPVQMQCLEDALAEEAGIIDLRLIHGIRGGLTNAERRRLQAGVA